MILIVTGVFISLVELALPKIIQYFIDTLTNGSSTKNLYSMITGFVFLVILMINAMMFQNKIQITLQEMTVKDIQADLLKRIRQLEFQFSDQYPIGKTLSLLNGELESIRKIYSGHLPYIVKDSIFVSVSLLIMISMDYRLTLTILPCLGLYYLIGPYFERKAEQKSRIMTLSGLEYNQYVYESLSAMDEVKAYGARKWNYKNLMNRLIRHNQDMVIAFLYAFARGSVRRLTYYIGAVVFFIYGSNLVRLDVLTVGKFVAFLFYYFNTMHRLTSIITNITELRIKLFQAEKIHEILTIESSIVSGNGNFPKNIEVIEFKNVSFSFNDESLVLEDINLKMYKNQKIALIGASGSGKSTFIKLLGRYYDPKVGEILIQNTPLKSLRLQDFRIQTGFMFQETSLFNGTVMENIQFGNAHSTLEDVISASKKSFAHEFIERLPQGYDTVLSERGKNLSGGQLQRIAIARLFLKNPSIIILDEATSALDNIGSRIVSEAIDNLAKGRIVVTIAHRLETIKDYDRIVVFEKGRIKKVGSPKDILDSDRIF